MVWTLGAVYRRVRDPGTQARGHCRRCLRSRSRERRTFFSFCERANKRKPKLVGKGKGRLHPPPLNPPGLQGSDAVHRSVRLHRLRFETGRGPRPEGHRPDAQSLRSSREGDCCGAGVLQSHPPGSQAGPPWSLMAEVKNTILGAFRFGRDEDPIVKAVMPEVEKLVVRYLKLACWCRRACRPTER